MLGRQGLRLESVLYAQRDYGGGCSGSIASRQLVRYGQGLVTPKRTFVCSVVFLNRDNGLVIKFSMFGRLGYFRNGFKFAFDGFAVATFCFRGAVWFSLADCGISGADLLLTSPWLQWLQGAVALGCQ